MSDHATPFATDLSAELWIIGRDLKMGDRLNRLCLRDATIGLLNADELWQAERLLSIATNRLLSNSIPLPTGFPLPRLGLPESGLAPDFFKQSGYIFVSHQFREALAQPEQIVEFTPIDLVKGGEEARAQDYRQMRVIAEQPAIDFYLSDCSVREFVSRIDGRRSMQPYSVDQLALLDGLQPHTAIFQMEEIPTYILVTDAVAERILRAGCTGVEFEDPTNLHYTDKPRRYRGKKGAVIR